MHTGFDKFDNGDEDEVFLVDAIPQEELLPKKKCIDCNQMYICKKEKIKTSCKMCKSNAHGCMKESDHEKSKGDAWLCGDCVQFIDTVDQKYPELFQELKNTGDQMDKKKEKDGKNG